MTGAAVTPGAFVLPEELTIFTVGEWLPLVRGLAQQVAGEKIVVDASEVQEADGAGVQLLISLANTVSARGVALVLSTPSAALSKACADLGARFLIDAMEPTGSNA